LGRSRSRVPQCHATRATDCPLEGPGSRGKSRYAPEFVSGRGSGVSRARYGLVNLMTLPNSETLAPAGRAELTLAKPRQPGPVYAFLPAHGDSRVGAIQTPLNRTWTEDLGLAVLLANFSTREPSVWQPQTSLRRLDGHTWGAFVHSEPGADVLDARLVTPSDLGPLLDHARRKYQIVSVDLTGARETQALEVVRAATSIFLVSSSDLASLELAREKVECLGKLGLEERCALLLRRVSGGLRPDVAEDAVGTPVCSLVEDDAQVRDLACWLGSLTAAMV
jgi:hypothetical protein